MRTAVFTRVKRRRVTNGQEPQQFLAEQSGGSITWLRSWMDSNHQLPLGGLLFHACVYTPLKSI